MVSKKEYLNLLEQLRWKEREPDMKQILFNLAKAKATVHFRDNGFDVKIEPRLKCPDRLYPNVVGYPCTQKDQYEVNSICHEFTPEGWGWNGEILHRHYTGIDQLAQVPDDITEARDHLQWRLNRLYEIRKYDNINYPETP
jgi:hypothetical protein